jgi:hypothetical protein
MEDLPFVQADFSENVDLVVSIGDLLLLKRLQVPDTHGRENDFHKSFLIF